MKTPGRRFIPGAGPAAIAVTLPGRVSWRQRAPSSLVYHEPGAAVQPAVLAADTQYASHHASGRAELGELEGGVGTGCQFRPPSLVVTSYAWQSCRVRLRHNHGPLGQARLSACGDKLREERG